MKSKYFITAFAVLALIGSSLAIKSLGNLQIANDAGTLVLNDGIPTEEEKDELTSSEIIAVPSSTESPIMEIGGSKEWIWHMMLNTVDYYDKISGRFFYSISDLNDVYEVSFDTDINTSEAFSSISKVEANNADNAFLSADANQTLDLTKTNTYEFSLYSDGESYYNIDNLTRAYTVDKNAAIKREDSVAEDDEARYFTDDNGIPCYSYRADSTNAYLAKSCIFPQEMTFGFLTDFNLWEIKGEEQYLNRECYVISGTTNDAYGQKIGVNDFEFYVDKSTGVLLKYSGYDTNGQLCDFLTVTEISFDDIDKISTPELQRFVQK